MTIDQAVTALAAGRVVGMPTDTVYGLAADPSDREALHGLLALKGRPEERPIALLAADIEQARTLAEFSEAAERLSVSHWPGPLTLVLPREPGLPDWLGDPHQGTVGVRVPDHPVASRLLAAFGPLAVTSANRSGEPPVTSAEEARLLFGGLVAVYLPGTAPGGEASTVVDTTVEPYRVLRRGPARI